MRLPARDRQEGLGFNMTPMIDVVFLLIIFFLVSSHLAQQEVQLELELPAAASGHDVTDDTRPRVTVNILPDGQLMLGSEPLGQENLARRLGVEAKKSPADLEVRIRSDRHVAYRLVEPILIACTQAGIWNVTFAVTREN